MYTLKTTHLTRLRAIAGTFILLCTAQALLAQPDIELKSDGDLRFLDQQSSIRFPATTPGNAPMIYMFESGISNADRMLFAHSPAYANWGLEYRDTTDIFNIVGNGNRGITFNPLLGRIGLGTQEPAYPLQIHSNSGTSYMRISDNTTGEGSGLRIGLNGTGSSYFLNDHPGGTINMGTGGSSDVEIEDDGDIKASQRIGAANTSPVFPIDVRDNTYDRAGYFYNNRSTTNTTIGIYGGAFGDGAGDKRGGAFDAVNGTGTNIGVRGFAQNGTTNIGVYGYATGGTTAWAAHFDAGDVKIDDHMSVGDFNPSSVYPLYVRKDADNQGSAFFYNTRNSSSTNFGLVSYGYNLGTGSAYGLYTYASSTSGNGYGIYAYGNTFGVYCVGNEYISGDLRVGHTDDVTGYRISANGDILCEELKVQNSVNWPDYVFQPSYRLMPLSELKEHIRVNGHLPGVPSARQVEADKGVEVGEMQKTLLEKVEELTLYLIQLHEKNAQLEAELNVLKAQIAGDK